MRKSERALRARRDLDVRFAEIDVEQIRHRPGAGWIRAVRTGLGMSQEVLASRLGISKPSVAKLERNEMHDTIGIGKLAEVARAMDCELVYAIVPRSSLDQTVRAQAEQVAARTVNYVAATMALEDQSIAAEDQTNRLGDMTQRVIEANRQWERG